MFGGEASAGVFEILDIEMADTWTHCKKIAIPMETEMASSVMMVVTETESLLILGGAEKQAEIVEDQEESQEEQCQSSNDAASQESSVDNQHRFLILDSNSVLQLVQIDPSIIETTQSAELGVSLFVERVD